MDAFFAIGQLLFGGFFVYSGVMHLVHRAMMTGYAASKGVPLPAVAVVGSGLLILVGGLSVLTGIRPNAGAILIAIFLIAVTPAMHNFWAVTDANQRMGEMVNFTKNVALLGAALMLMRATGPWFSPVAPQ